MARASLVACAAVRGRASLGVLGQTLPSLIVYQITRAIPRSLCHVAMFRIRIGSFIACAKLNVSMFTSPAKAL
eukprot:2297400-Pyramimonas_sp.AAC.1